MLGQYPNSLKVLDFQIASSLGLFLTQLFFLSVAVFLTFIFHLYTFYNLPMHSNPDIPLPQSYHILIFE